MSVLVLQGKDSILRARCGVACLKEGDRPGLSVNLTVLALAFLWDFTWHFLQPHNAISVLHSVATFVEPILIALHVRDVRAQGGT